MVSHKHANHKKNLNIQKETVRQKWSKGKQVLRGQVNGKFTMSELLKSELS